MLTRQDFTTPQQVGGSTLDRYTVATACTFLAGKVEETPKKLRDVIVKSHHIRHSFEHGEDTRYDALRTDSPAYENLRESVLTAERKILQLLAFDLSIEHPYKYIIEFVKRVADGNKKVAQAAWNFVNDSLRTTLCLQYRAHVIASAAIFLAARHCTVQLAGADGKEWFECLDCKIDDLDYIANRILDLYHQAEKSGELKAAVNVEAPSLRSPSMQTPSPRVGSSPSPDIRATPPPPPRPSPFAQPPPPPPVSQPPPPSSRSRSPPPPPPPGRPAEPPQRAGYRPSPPPHQHERERGYNTTPPRRRSPPPRPPSRTFRRTFLLLVDRAHSLQPRRHRIATTAIATVTEITTTTTTMTITTETTIVAMRSEIEITGETAIVAMTGTGAEANATS